MDINAISKLPVEAATLIMSLAAKAGTKSKVPNWEPDINPEAYEHALIMKPAGKPQDKPLFLLVKQPFAGIVYNPADNSVEEVDPDKHREAKSWLTRHFPPADRPEVSRPEAWLLVSATRHTRRQPHEPAAVLVTTVRGAFQQHGVEEKWRGVAKSLVARLASMSEAELNSLWDSVDAFHDLSESPEFLGENWTDAVRAFFKVKEDSAG